MVLGIMRIIGNNKVDRNLLRGMFSVLGATGLDAICRLLVVMILVRYYSKESFGVWAAITSVAAIVVTGDFGIINALRNKISQLLVEENESNVISQKYFYSAFYFFLLIAIVLALLLLCFTPYIPFEFLFKTNDFELQSIGVKILIYVQIIFVFTIPLTIGNSLYFTFQESHFSALFTSLQAVFTVLIIYILSLCHVSIVFISIAYFLINTLFSFWGTLYFVFRHKWFHFKVSWRDIYKCNIELFKVGIKFMSLQLSSSFLQNAGTIIASAVLGVKIAADYSMYTKLYTLGIAIFQSVFNPLWGSYAAAIYRRDFAWCQRTYYYNLKIIFFIFISFSVLLCFCGNFFLRIIASEEYSTSFVMYLLLGISTLFFMLFNSASIIPKACNRINILLVISIISCILITPVANLSLKNMGLYGLPVTTTLFWGVSYWVMHWQTKRIINEK